MKKAYKILLFLLVFIPSFSSAQCKHFTKNKVLPKLNGYVQNDTYNSTQMAPGWDAEVMITFFGGRDYRLLVDAHPILGEVEFTVSDTNGKQIHSNKDTQNKESFDFKMKNTQQLVIKVKVPEQKNTMIQHIGCVSIVSGFKK